MKDSSLKFLRIILIIGICQFIVYYKLIPKDYFISVIVMVTFVVLQLTKKYSKERRFKDLMQVCCIQVLLFTLHLLKPLPFVENALIYFVALVINLLTVQISARFA